MLHLHDFTYGLATPALSYIVASIGTLLGLRAVTRKRIVTIWPAAEPSLGVSLSS